MLKDRSIKDELIRHRKKLHKAEDLLLEQVQRMLNANLLNEKNILNNLKFYNTTFELLNDDELDRPNVFKKAEIKGICTKYRLRFLNSQYFRGEIPYEAVLKIKDLNSVYHKDLKGFKILASRKAFLLKEKRPSFLLFAPTIAGDYYLVHAWGQKMKWHRKLLAWPLSTFESLFTTVAIITAIIAVSLPTYLITLDREAPYWCGYRMATFFHILIFNSGVTTYFTFALNKNFSNSVWNSENL